MQRRVVLARGGCQHVDPAPEQIRDRRIEGLGGSDAGVRVPEGVLAFVVLGIRPFMPMGSEADTRLSSRRTFMQRRTR